MGRLKMRRPLLIVALTFCAAAVSVAGAPGVLTTAATAAAQCRGTDRIIPKRIRFARGRTTAVIKDTVRLCTGHEYRLRARAGQTMTVHLATGSKTSFTVYTPT